MGWKIKDKSQMKFFGQYVQFNQKDTDWKKVMEALYTSPYNGYVVHLLTPWGNKNKFYPWTYNAQTKKFDLTKMNEAWYEHFERFVRAAAENDISLSLAFFDRYFLERYADNKWNPGPWPFVNNNVGINWSEDEEPLYESWNKTGGSNPPDSAFAWVKWKTNGLNGFAEKVISYKPIGKIGKALVDYIRRVAKILAEVHKEHPVWVDTMFIRVHNENIFRADTHSDIGGETKLTEIVQMIFEEEGLIHPKDFRMVDDTFPVNDDDEIGTLIKWQKFLVNKKWFGEIHNCSLPFVKECLERGLNQHNHIFSTDGLKPEKNPFFKDQHTALTKLNLHFLDYKVPSELSTYHDQDYEKTFEKVLPLMKDHAREPI